MTNPALLPKIDPSDVERIRKSPLFDPEWYVKTYPEVAMLDMDPAEHYLKYGALLRRDPGPDFSTGFYLDTHPGGWQEQTNPLLRCITHDKGEMRPRTTMVLRAANELIRCGRNTQGIDLAKKYLPNDLQYTIELLKANIAINLKQENKWLSHVNAYLAHNNVSPVCLTEGNTIFERLGSNPLPRVANGPKISVIMTAWNAETGIRNSALSILNQTWGNLELIIVDDSSDDQTWGECQKLAAEDERVKILRNAINCGTYTSKNIACEICDGDWITCQDADDWSHPMRLENHMNEVLKYRSPPRCSCISMLRLYETGLIDRLTPISDYSLDGVARDAPISVLFERDFFFSQLGGWDHVRFGADSEIIERCRLLVGDEYKRFCQIGMFCLISDSGLTSNPDHFIDRKTGPSEKPREYAKAFRCWHQTLSRQNPGMAKLDVKKFSERPFPAPESFVVSKNVIQRNRASLLDLCAVSSEAVTAICVSKRPKFTRNVASMMSKQTHKNLNFIYVAHGEQQDETEFNGAFSELENVSVIFEPDSQITLGALLNRALDICKTDLVAKIDDDDFYGPNYIKRSLMALKFNGYENVGIVGKGRAYCYVEGLDQFAIRFQKHTENALRPHVFGGTLFWSRTAVNDLRFQDLPRAIDVAFIKDALHSGTKLFSADRFDYVAVRHANVEDHTWKIGDEEFLRPATRICKGLRLDLAYSSAFSRTYRVDE